MKKRILLFIAAFVSVMFMSCDDTTGTVGSSLTDDMDMLEVSTDTFQVTSRSIVADSVLSRNTTGYLGIIRDPETGNYITGNFMAQFGTLEDYSLPELDSIASLTEDFADTDTEEQKINKIVADSCHIRLFFMSYYGDSLATMNMTAHEMVKPMSEDVQYYSNFDPKAEGFVDDKAFEGGKAENYVLEIGSKQFIPGFEDGMVGMKIGEEKDIKVTFPKEYGAAHLAGKDAVFKVKLHEIQELKIPELDDEMLKKLLPGEEKASVEVLDEKLKEQIKNEKLFKLVNDELKGKFADALIEKYNFDLPKGIVEQETDMQMRAAFNTFSEKEIEELKASKEKYQEKRDSFKEEAQKSVKLTFIIDELAKLRKIEVNDQELIQAIYFEAYRYGMNPKEHLENYKKQGALPAVKMALIEEKLFNDIFIPKTEKSEKVSKKEKEDK